MADTKLLILGFGYSAAEVARLAPTDVAIVGTVRSAERARAMSRAGLSILAFDGRATPEIEREVRTADMILVSIPPGLDGGGDPDVPPEGKPADAALAGLSPAFLAAKPKAIVYLSTVGVYGDHDGAWVDETMPATPASARSLARLAAEEAWRALGRTIGAPVAVLRLAGIYGPGQNAVENIRAGTARRIVKPGQVFNRIHVTDIARVTWAALEQAYNGVLNVTDDEPAPPQDVIVEAARLLGVAPPPEIPFENAAMSPMGRSFYSENKRVSNGRLKTALGITLAYPTYREGLAAAV